MIISLEPKEYSVSELRLEAKELKEPMNESSTVEFECSLNVFPVGFTAFSWFIRIDGETHETPLDEVLNIIVKKG